MIPNTSDGLKAAGYIYDRDARCRGCEAPIEWWITPTGRRMPMDVKREWTLGTGFIDVREPHWATCPNADAFRKKKTKARGV